jgi:predicted O-methyltransferase YrrM
MDKKGFIFIIENNQGDYKIFLDIFRELGFSNEILYFNSGDDVYDYIQKNAVQPFLVFLDIVLLQMEKSKLSTYFV